MLVPGNDSSLVLLLSCVCIMRFSNDNKGWREQIRDLFLSTCLFLMQILCCLHDCYKWNGAVIFYLFYANFFDIGSDQFLASKTGFLSLCRNQLKQLSVRTFCLQGGLVLELIELNQRLTTNNKTYWYFGLLK